MSKRRSVIGFFLAFTAVVLGPRPVLSSEISLVFSAPEPRTILFFGNSFVAANNGLHNHLRKLAQSVFPGKSKELFFYAKTIGGAGLSDHVPGAEDKIKNFSHDKKHVPWDLVVLQGQSSEPVRTSGADKFKKAARKLNKQIRASGSRTAFFMTWAYKGKPEMATSLNHAYTRTGENLDALVVPVGLAFDLARYSNPTMELYARDGIHPSLLGTYLAANVFFATLYGISPVGASYTAGLSKQEVIFAQSTALKAVQDYF